MVETSRGRALIIVGGKPTIRYVTAIITAFNTGERTVLLRARGKRIYNCVEVVNMLRKSFMSDVRVEAVEIGSERVKIGELERNVSFIEITLQR